MGISDHLRLSRLIGRLTYVGPTGRSPNAAVEKGQDISKGVEGVL